MTNPITQLRTQLLDTLGQVTQANGFYTNAGLQVRSGWFEEIVQSEKHSGPLIIVQRGTDEAPSLEAGQLVLSPTYLIVGAVDSGFDDYQAALDDLEHDLYSMLARRSTRSVPWAGRLSTYRMTFGDPLQAPPGGGTRWASLAIPVTFKLIINRFDR